MKIIHASIAVVLVLTSLAACSNSSAPYTHSPRTSVAATSHDTGVQPKRDDDGDFDHNDDDASTFYYGRAATTTEARAVTATVQGYYRAAAAGDGAAGCKLLPPVLAQTIVEDYGVLRITHGHTCAAVLTKIFLIKRRTFAGEAGVKVEVVRVLEHKALAVLKFPNHQAIRQIFLRRYASNRWGVRELSDEIVE